MPLHPFTFFMRRAQRVLIAIVALHGTAILVLDAESVRVVSFVEVVLLGEHLVLAVD